MLRHLPLTIGLLASLGACAAEPPSSAAGAPAAAAPAAAPVAAGEPAIRAAVAKLLPGVEVASIAGSPIAGWSEVAVQGRVFYVSNDGKYLIHGALVDVASDENLTRLSEGALRKDLLDAVGADRRIVFAAAQPKHRITVFTDIDCGYCQRLHQQMADYNRLGISVEYLFYPRAGINSESFEQAVAVWCASDRRAALTAAKSGAVLPHASCTNPVRMDFELARKVGVDGTPAIYADNGVQLGGYLEPTEMLARLDKMAAGQP
jgi:thiol:disulfide interchange protein DsbC